MGRNGRESSIWYGGTRKNLKSEVKKIIFQIFKNFHRKPTKHWKVGRNGRESSICMVAREKSQIGGEKNNFLKFSKIFIENLQNTGKWVEMVARVERLVWWHAQKSQIGGEKNNFFKFSKIFIGNL